MAHPDADDLALLALGEAPTPEQEAHLAACSTCAAELDELRATVRLGRSTAAEDRLVPPAPHVWGAVQEELGFADVPAARAETPQRRRRALRVGTAAALVLVLAVTAAALVVGRADRGQPQVLAETRLAALPRFPDASGSAALERLDDGRLVVRVRLTTPPLAGAYRELWLLGGPSDAVSLGVVDQNDAVYAVPADLDLARFDVVDVSRERPDGDPAHSTDSILRGTLQAAADGG